MSDYEKIFIAASKPTLIILEDEQEETTTHSDSIQRRSSLYGPSKFFHHQQIDFFTSVERKPKLESIAKPTRESIANSLNIIAKGLRQNDIKFLRLIPLTLVTISVQIMQDTTTKEQEKQLICDLEICQHKIATFDRIIAFDLNLILADYHYFIQKSARTASIYLQKASRLVPNNLQLTIETLEKAQQLSEEAEDYTTALNIESKLDTYDLAFDWKERRAEKRKYLEQMYKDNNDNF